ncbi:MAG: hypothetical protein OXC05_10825 [Halieaceae bacterium]|nr:hypothetical protein [Halieaceae bacterium]
MTERIRSKRSPGGADSAVLQPYLDRYAEPESGNLPGLKPCYENVLVAPCFDESQDFLEELLNGLPAGLLIILVVNAPDNAGAAAIERSARLWRIVGGKPERPFQVGRYREGMDILAINRVSAERLIPHRQGVGLARKIGADAACMLIATGRIKSPWIYMTDADVRLPPDYFQHAPATAGCALLPFHHRAPAALAAQICCYETKLRYYVNRLRAANSPYAFHTIGSTIAIHAETYAKVRGVPKRNAGEDFHLLNKAAKVAPVHRLRRPEISIRARLSQRVPFGTGPALADMGDTADYRSYAPQSFACLAEAIAHIERGAALPELTAALLDELGFQHFIERARRQRRHPETLRKATHQWFDGLRTLRFIHLARRHYPDQPLSASLDELLGPVDHLQRLKELELENETRALPRIYGRFKPASQ